MVTGRQEQEICRRRVGPRKGKRLGNRDRWSKRWVRRVQSFTTNAEKCMLIRGEGDMEFSRLSKLCPLYMLHKFLRHQGLRLSGKRSVFKVQFGYFKGLWLFCVC